MSAQGKESDSQLPSSINGLVYMGAKSGTGPLQGQRLAGDQGHSLCLLTEKQSKQLGEVVGNGGVIQNTFCSKRA